MGDMEKLRVALDTNVLIAGLRSRNGASFLVLSHWLLGHFVVCASVPLWLEYEATLKRKDVAIAHSLSEDEIVLLLDAWSRHVVPVEFRFVWRPQLRDPNDEMVLETALNGRADALVTFNRADFDKAARRFGLSLWRPQELLARLGEAS